MNVLVVDDEPVIRQGLRTLVEWELHGFRLAGEAGDGEEALAYMAEHPVDLVVTDLLMPRMDGLELIRRIREAQTSVGILVLSCLDDFACVKEAMKLGAADYLLKPTMEPEQLLEVLGHMRTELLRSRQEQERLLRWQRENEETKLMRLSRRTGAFLAGGAAEPELERELFADGGQLAVVVVKVFSGNETASSAVETAAVETGCVAVIRLREQQQLALYGLQRSASRQEQHGRRAACAEALAKRLRAALEDGCRAVVSAGPAVAGLTELKLLAGWHEQRLHRHFYAGELRPGAGAAGPRTPGPVTMLAEEAGPPPAPVAGAAAVAPLPYEARNDLLRALAGGNAAGVRHQLERVAAHVLAARPPAGELLAFAAELVVMAEDAVRQHTSTPGAAADYSRRRAELVASASAAPHAQALFAWLGQAVEELLCLPTAGSGGGQASANPFVRMARQYMQENYSRNLSTAEIAEHVKLNRSYLSELYSRETGETLSEALARIRMEAAKEMLKEGRMKVYEVAEAAGYSDSKIFTKAFKRMTGLTPKKFQ